MDVWTFSSLCRNACAKIAFVYGNLFTFFRKKKKYTQNFFHIFLSFIFPMLTLIYMRVRIFVSSEALCIHVGEMLGIILFVLERFVHVSMIFGRWKAIGFNAVKRFSAVLPFLFICFAVWLLTILKMHRIGLLWTN